MANDNLLAGLTGAAEGVKDVLVPWIQMRQKANIDDQLSRNRMREQSAQEMNQKLSLLPFEEQSQMRLKKQEQDATLSRESQLQNQRLSAQAEMERSKDYVYGQDILDLYPNLRTQGIQPERRYNKALIANILKGTGLLSKDEQKNLDSAKSGLAVLHSLREQYSSLPHGVGAVGNSLLNKATLGKFGNSGLRSYNDAMGANAVKFYRGYTLDNRLSDADAQARALPLIPTGEMAPETGLPKYDSLEKQTLLNVSAELSKAGISPDDFYKSAISMPSLGGGASQATPFATGSPTPAASKYKDGDTKVIGNRTYTRRNGAWQ